MLVNIFIVNIEQVSWKIQPHKSRSHDYRIKLKRWNLWYSEKTLKASKLEITTQLDLPGTEANCWVNWWSEHLQTWSPTRSNDNHAHHHAEPGEQAQSRVGMTSKPGMLRMLSDVNFKCSKHIPISTYNCYSRATLGARCYGNFAELSLLYTNIVVTYTGWWKYWIKSRYRRCSQVLRVICKRAQAYHVIVYHESISTNRCSDRR